MSGISPRRPPPPCLCPWPTRPGGLTRPSTRQRPPTEPRCGGLGSGPTHPPTPTPPLEPPRTPLYQQALALTKAEHLGEALKTLDSDPWLLEPRVLLGRISRHQGRLDLAIEQLRHAIYQRPNFWPAHGELAECRQAAGQRDAARREYEITLRLLAAGPEVLAQAAGQGEPAQASTPGALTAATAWPPVKPSASPAPTDPPPAAPVTPVPTVPMTSYRAPDSARVPLAKLDELARLIGEVLSVQARLRQRLLEAQALDRSAQIHDDTGTLGLDHDLTRALHTLVRELRDTVQAQEFLTAGLGERALILRMLPLSMVFEPSTRKVRELTRAAGKEVRCEVEGGEIELDRQIIERLGDSLVHLVRNAMDHGMDDPDERRAAGMPLWV